MTYEVTETVTCDRCEASVSRTPPSGPQREWYPDGWSRHSRPVEGDPRKGFEIEHLCNTCTSDLNATTESWWRGESKPRRRRARVS